MIVSLLRELVELQCSLREASLGLHIVSLSFPFSLPTTSFSDDSYPLPLSLLFFWNIEFLNMSMPWHLILFSVLPQSKTNPVSRWWLSPVSDVPFGRCQLYSKTHLQNGAHVLDKTGCTFNEQILANVGPSASKWLDSQDIWVLCFCILFDTIEHKVRIHFLKVLQETLASSSIFNFNWMYWCT